MQQPNVAEIVSSLCIYNVSACLRVPTRVRIFVMYGMFTAAIGISAVITAAEYVLIVVASVCWCVDQQT